tara:strand:+ start:954 stop:1421 length:468 start_codon:yes stop_codon:yes gene_type:complete
MKNLTLTTVVLFLSLSVFAQKDWDRKRERMETQKIAFITSSIDLTSVEAQKFWPIYNTQMKEIEILREQKHKILEDMHQDVNQMSEREIEKNIMRLFEIEAKELAFKKSHFSEMKKVIGSRKFAQLRKAEMQFKKELLKKIKGHRGGPPSPPRPR